MLFFGDLISLSAVPQITMTRDVGTLRGYSMLRMVVRN